MDYECDDCGEYQGRREVCPLCGAICALAPEPTPAWAGSDATNINEPNRD